MIKFPNFFHKFIGFCTMTARNRCFPKGKGPFFAFTENNPETMLDKQKKIWYSS